MQTPATLDQRVELVRKLEPTARMNGFHLGVTGSLLFNGSSENDGDLIMYPHANVITDDPEPVIAALGFTRISDNGIDPNYDRNVVKLRHPYFPLPIDLFILS